MDDRCQLNTYSDNLRMPFEGHPAASALNYKKPLNKKRSKAGKSITPLLKEDNIPS